MKLFATRRTPTDELKDAAIAALVSALEDRQREAKDKPGLTPVRAVAAGAVIYTVGRVAFKGRRLVSDHLSSSSEDEQSPEESDAFDDDHDEPDASEEEPEATPTPLPARKPMHRAARKKGAQPSLKRPQRSRRS